MFVQIFKGTHRGSDVRGVYPLVKEFNGKFVTVKTNGLAPFTVENARIIVEEGDFDYCSSEGEAIDSSVLTTTMPGGAGEQAPNYEQEFLSNETEAEALDRIHDTFERLNEVTEASVRGIMRGVVISGPPGIGKSHGVMETLERENLTKVLRGMEPDYDVIKGNASAIGLYQTLFFYKKKGQVVLIDDCDDVLYDQTSLNLLKAALDSGKKRRLSWRTESRVLADAGVPDTFEFEGSVIFLTNVNFETSRGKIAMHLQALKSRCHYLDLGISNQRDQLLRIKQIVRDGMLKDYEFVNNEEDLIVQYIEDNADYMQELSLRMVGKIADIVQMKEGADWVPMVESTCLTRDAKYKRLRLAQQADVESEVTA